MVREQNRSQDPVVQAEPGEMTHCVSFPLIFLFLSLSPRICLRALQRSSVRQCGEDEDRRPMEYMLCARWMLVCSIRRGIRQREKERQRERERERERETKRKRVKEEKASSERDGIEGRNAERTEKRERERERGGKGERECEKVRRARWGWSMERPCGYRATLLENKAGFSPWFIAYSRCAPLRL